ncbi:MAG: arginine--tRNA ligase [Candidatus Micrarchaeaceae archaeon]
MKDNPLLGAIDAFAMCIISALQAVGLGTDADAEQVRASISIGGGEHGDMNSSIAFRIAHKIGRPPHEVAAEIVGAAKARAPIFRIEELDGYINAWLDVPSFSKDVIETALALAKDYGRSEIGGGEKVIVEFPSVNPNKPWHVGHLRNALLGDAISNILALCSYSVERIDYIDDLGLQMAEILWGIGKIGAEPDKKYDAWLGEAYVKINKMLDERGKEEVKTLLKKMEDPKSKEASDARKVAERCVRAQYETAYNYGISHDLLIWESDIVSAGLLEKAFKIGLEKGAVEKLESGEYAGCIVASLKGSKYKELKELKGDKKILIRSNGVATYTAKDIAFHMWKFGMLEDPFKYSIFISEQPNGKALYSTGKEGKAMNFGGAQRSINIIGSAQKYPQLVLKAVLEGMGYAGAANNLVHLSYGEVGIEGSALISGRRGEWIGTERNYTADDLLEEVKSKALGIINASNKIDANLQEEVAAKVALGAIKFEFLRIAPEKKITFSWQRALDFESNSGPYCMYMYARAMRILEKAEKAELGHAEYKSIGSGIEFELIKLIGKMPSIVEKAAKELRPDMIAGYAIELSTVFSKFYETMPVLKAGAARGARLAITAAFAIAISNSLRLLGIETVEKM